MVDIDLAKVRAATLTAASILTGMGYLGAEGGIHLLELKLQNNTITAILHNIVAWQISRLDTRWTFHPKGGATPDLTDSRGNGIQVKVSSDGKIKGNAVSSGEGYHIAVKYSRGTGGTQIQLNEILVGELEHDDWERPRGTQWGILKKAAETSKLRRIYP